jgi:hypothetical protein
MFTSEEVDEFVTESIAKLDEHYLCYLASSGKPDTYGTKATFYYNNLRAMLLDPLQDDVTQIRLIKAVSIRCEEYVTLYYQDTGRI